MEVNRPEVRTANAGRTKMALLPVRPAPLTMTWVCRSEEFQLCLASSCFETISVLLRRLTEVRLGTIDRAIRNSGTIDRAIRNSGTIDRAIRNSGTIDRAIRNSGTIDRAIRNNGTIYCAVKSNGTTECAIRSN